MNEEKIGSPEMATTQPRGWRRFFSRNPRSVPPPSLWQQLTQCACALAVALSSYWVATHFMFQTVIVDGDSMKPTLHNADQYLLNRAEYLFRDPKPGDIVVIHDPEDGGLSVKRIVATGGETVELEGGSVYVNGRKLVEQYLPKGTLTFSYHVYDHEKFACAKDQVFVLGDNRGQSADSRIYGPVPRRNILGVVMP
jgi:signal peptidase I